MQTDEEIETLRVRLEGAFKPFRCVAEVWDYNRKLRFKVFDNNNRSIIEVPQILLRALIDESNLQDLIEQARAQIHSRRPDFP